MELVDSHAYARVALVLNPSTHTAQACGDSMREVEAYAQHLLLQAGAAEPLTDAQMKLAAFGAWCADEFRQNLADLDGGSAQDEMERLGVIVKRVVTESCGYGCVCVEYGDFPHDCYVLEPEMRDALKSFGTPAVPCATQDATECARSLLTLADWHEAPSKTEWGEGMMAADVMLTKDETMTVYAHRDALTK